MNTSSRPPAPILTVSLIAMSVIATLLALDVDPSGALGALLIGTPGTPPFSDVLHGEVWRLVTPIFLHFGILHIFFNMWWLLDIGSAIETRIGELRYAALVFFTAVVSNVAQYAWTGDPFFGGMSGVLYALFAYAWVRGRLDRSFGPMLSP